MTAVSETPRAAGQHFTIGRAFDARREIVWKAWTEAERLAQWWGPNGFTNPLCDMDVRVGGAIRIDMRGPDGTAYPMTGTFRAVVAPRRPVFMAVPVDHDGHVQLESLTTVTFEAIGPKTRLTVHASAVGFTAAAVRMLAGMEAGWTQSRARLGALIADNR